MSSRLKANRWLLCILNIIEDLRADSVEGSFMQRMVALKTRKRTTWLGHVKQRLGLHSEELSG